MATKKTIKKKLFRFYGFFDNISIGPKIHLNRVKIILHEQYALTLDEAYELYKIYLTNTVGILSSEVKQHLIDLYYKTIYVEEIDATALQVHEIKLIK